MTYSSGSGSYWMRQLFIGKVNFIKNGRYLSKEAFPSLPQKDLIFSTILPQKKSISKRVILLGRDIFRTGGGPTSFARWKDCLSKVVLLDSVLGYSKVFRLHAILHYYTMLLGSFYYKPVKKLATAKRLVDLQTVVCLVT